MPTPINAEQRMNLTYVVTQVGEGSVDALHYHSTTIDSTVYYSVTRVFCRTFRHGSCIAAEFQRFPILGVLWIHSAYVTPFNAEWPNSARMGRACLEVTMLRLHKVSCGSSATAKFTFYRNHIKCEIQAAPKLKSVKNKLLWLRNSNKKQPLVG